MEKHFKPLHKLIAEKLIEELKKGTSPFQKPWKDDNGAAFTPPLNPTTGKNYRGMNALWLVMQNREDPRWLTLKQASFNHWSVENGARATLISFFKTSDIQPVLDEKGNKIPDENGKAQTRVVPLEKPFITNAWVFNAEQIRGIPAWQEVLEEKQLKQTWTPVGRAENIVKASKAMLRHGGNQAYYDPVSDRIQMPKKQQFASAARYYATLLHELGHWTGHNSRMNRLQEDSFAPEAYAREELRAEIASLMIGGEINIGHDFGQHAAYVDSWIKVLQDDPFELYRASADAQKIFDFIIATEQTRERRQDPASRANTLLKDEVIAYNHTAYKVIDVLPAKHLCMEDLTTGNRFKLSPKDGLYNSLLGARNKPLLGVTTDPVSEKATAGMSPGCGKENWSERGIRR
jgi:antirestriction protein ArdC